MRCEKRERLVSPIIAEARRTVLLVERIYREKLDRTDAEILQIRNLLDQPSIGAAFCRRDAGTRVAGKSADMHLIDDGLGERPAQRLIAFPVIGRWVDDDAP